MNTQDELDKLEKAKLLGAKLAGVHVAMKKELTVSELAEIESMADLVGQEVASPSGVGIGDDGKGKLLVEGSVFTLSDDAPKGYATADEYSQYLQDVKAFLQGIGLTAGVKENFDHRWLGPMDEGKIHIYSYVNWSYKDDADPEKFSEWVDKARQYIDKGDSSWFYEDDPGGFLELAEYGYISGLEPKAWVNKEHEELYEMDGEGIWGSENIGGPDVEEFISEVRNILGREGYLDYVDESPDEFENFAGEVAKEGDVTAESWAREIMQEADDYGWTG